MEVEARILKKCYSNNGFAMSYMPLKSRASTFYMHEKGIVGICFINDIYGNEILLYFIKDMIEYSTRIKKFKSERSLALLISRFHLEIELLQNEL
jgi:hypothetical protein